MDDHIRRLYYDLNMCAPHYKIVDNTKIQFLPDKLYMHSFLYKDFKLFSYIISSEKEKSDRFCLFMKEINKECKKIFPKSQVIVVLYTEEENINWKSLKQEGIKIIRVNTDGHLYNQEYLTIDNSHPNGKAWQEITSVVIKELKL